MVTKVVLDCNVWDCLAADQAARERVRVLCESGCVDVLVPDTLLQELRRSPFNGVPDWFPTTRTSDSVFVLDHSRLGSARLGNGETYTAHRGRSKSVRDSIIVDCADIEADVFVSEDRRARSRYARLRGDGRSLDYPTFRSQVLNLYR